MRKVKGALFLDYVRMIRGRKDVAWREQLTAADLHYLSIRIERDAWYPMEVFERLGNAILRVVANNNLELVRAWGRFSVEQLHAEYQSLSVPHDPVETLSRFRVLRSTFFDFSALDIPLLNDEEAQVEIHYYMGMPAEEAASHQTMGFFERLLELAGGTGVQAEFRARSWAGDATTLLRLSWQMPRPPRQAPPADPSQRVVGRLRRRET